MKKFLLSTVALVALGTASAIAADLPARTYSKAPAYAAPIYNWTGVYIGGHIGAGFNNNSDLGVVGWTGGSSDAAFLGGGQIGADYQFAPNWVVGIEGQIGGLASNDLSFVNTVDGTISARSDWLASITGRLGYTWGPGLIYAKGGVAFRDDSGLTVVNAAGVAVPFTFEREQTGYTVGAGLEYMFAPAWSAKVEYQYYNFDNTAVFAPAVGLPVLGASFNDDLHSVKVGVNYHFNWGGPAVPRY